MKVRVIFFILLTLYFFLGSCGQPMLSNGKKVRAVNSLDLTKKDFESNVNGISTSLYFLKNSNNMRVAFTNYGGRIVGLWVPDKKGDLIDVVVGLPSISAYQLSTEPYFGATIGRYGNRIANGRFFLDKEEFELPLNNGPNTLHGGDVGFESLVFDTEQPDSSTIIFTLLSKHSDQGFPGNLKVNVIYTLTSGNALKMQYEAETDRKTVVNLTNHAFFNLNGEGSGTILNHLVRINADEFLPVDSTLIPYGESVSVEGTPFDFRTSIAIGARIDYDNTQLKNGKGYDHNFILKKSESNLNYAATAVGDISGIQMDIYTKEPGLQFYSGNFMQGENMFKSGTKDDYRTAFAMETQHFPNSPNESTYPSTELSPGERYQTESIYKFTVTGD